MLVCPHCKTRNTDPGGEPNEYVCGHCHRSGLYRKEEADSESIAGAAIGAILGGIISGGTGAVVGAIIGGILGHSDATSKKGGGK